MTLAQVAFTTASQPGPSIAPPTPLDPVPDLIELLGGKPVLIQWPRGTKGTRKKWGHLTSAAMTPSYLQKLKRGNIGVALGEVSGGLCAIDWDKDELIDEFLKLNPGLRGTLQTHGARGRVFWVRFDGRYPTSTVKLKDQTGEDLGEFRSNGSQSIIWGVHPETQKPYIFVNKGRVLTVSFQSIVWGARIANPPKIDLPSRNCTEETEATHGTDVTDVIGVEGSGGEGVSPGFFSCINSEEDALRHSTPRTVHENNHCLFVLARGVKALEVREGKYSVEERKAIFDRWYQLATPFLRAGQSKEDYMMEFFNAYRRAKYPLGGLTLGRAWNEANSKPLPREATFKNPKINSLVALCFHLQLASGEKPFFLSCRVCKTLLAQESHTTAANWLGALCEMDILEEVEKGSTKSNKASRYRYVSLKQTDHALPTTCQASGNGASGKIDDQTNRQP